LRVDLHAHLWPADYLDFLERSGHHERDWVMRTLVASDSASDIARRFADMDAAGVDVQVISIATLVPTFTDETTSRVAARMLNERYSEIVNEHPQRLRALAHLPMPHVMASLDEIAYAFDELGMNGVATTNSIFGRSIVDHDFDPIFEELDRRKAFLFIHPAADPELASLVGEYQIRNSIGPPLEDTLAVAHLITHGIPSRYPDLAIMVPHFGGAAPMLINRMDRQFQWEVPSAPERAAVAAKRLWYDTVGHNSLAALRCGIEALGVDRLVFGSDWPVLEGPVYAEAIRQIEREAGSAAETILGQTAVALLGLSRVTPV
jgi:aminocarboxymuconate-semialdehyde decarboxylase